MSCGIGELFAQHARRLFLSSQVGCYGRVFSVFLADDVLELLGLVLE